MSIEEVEANTTAELIEVALQMSQDWGKKPWFRGEPSASKGWQLQPTVRREFNRQAEASMTIEFRLRAPSRYPNCPENENYAKWICLMQHYGLSTRLLDWTRSVLCAAYFATAKHFDADGVVWVLRIAGVAGGGIRSIHDPEIVYSFLEPIFGHDKLADTDEVLPVEGMEIDLRMLVQQSSFTIHGSQAKPLNQRDDADQLLRKIIIPAEHKKAFFLELYRIGYHQEFLFPDLAHLAKHIRDSTPSGSESTQGQFTSTPTHSGDVTGP